MPGVYRFGAVEIRPVERQVVIDGRPAALGSRAFDVLLALIEHRDRLVTKNELLEMAWPGLVVEENNLQAQVSALRRLLGPHAIATIPGRGYRFALSSGSAQAPASAEPHPPSSPSRRSLPRSAGPLLGRDDELAALGRLLEQHRLITVVGAAGIGKTVVALAAAAERQGKLPDGVVWVELGPIPDAALLPATLAQALHVQASAGADLRVALTAALRNLQALVVIDNAEHVLDAVAGMIEEILGQAPGVSLLVTSRSALKLKSERLFRLGPLGVPEAGVAVDEARTFGAVALLEARAQALDPRFAITDENLASAIHVCRHLDGIALAIELAAARLPLLGMRGLAARIDERFRLLAANARDVPTRQQTLLAALDWSYELLSPDEQKVFRRLGVFARGFSLAMAIPVVRDGSTDEWAAIDALGALVDCSLVEVDAGAVPRYRLLESARAYALLKLGENVAELAAAQRAHAEAMLAAFEKADEESWTWRERDWLDAYAPELDNVRVALDWSVQHDRGLGAALAGASRFLFTMLGLDYELRLHCERLEPRADAALRPAIEARYWRARGESTRFVQRDQAVVFGKKAAALYRDVADPRGLYLALGECLLSAPPEEARAMLREMTAVERTQWPVRMRYWGERARAYIALQDGDVERVGRHLDRALELARACRSESMIQRTLVNVADQALAVGDVRKAIEVGREILADTSVRSNYHLLVVRGNLSNALLQAGDVMAARETIALYNATSRAAQWDTFRTFTPVFALLAATEGRFASAARLLGSARHASHALGGPWESNEARAFELAAKRVREGLAAGEVDSLMAEGERLDEEAICALTLEVRERSEVEGAAQA